MTTSAPGGIDAPAADPINILIVDDEPANLAVLETVLDDPSYRLVRALSADEALLALVRDEFALLVLDVRMPDLDGFELAQLIKERKKTASVPIIFLTAYYDEDQQVLQGYGSGAVDFLSKPVNAAVLKSKVAVFADLHRKTRAITQANQALRAEVQERRRAEDSLRELNQTLEDKVTERTEALHRADLQLREMMTSITDALFMLDREWRVTYANHRAALLLKTDARLLEQLCIWDLPPGALGSKFREHAERAITQGNTVYFDEYFPGMGKWLQCHCYPSERGLSVYFLDVTDRKQVEERRNHLLAAEQAARAEADRVARAKDDFLASLSHELRTPLAAILGWTAILQRRPLDDATVQRGIEVIARNAQAQSLLVSDLLDVGRVASGKLQVEFSPCDLNAVAALAADTLRPAAQAKGVTLTLQTQSKLPALVMGDEGRLHQIVSNLITNALKFTPAGGAVEVEVGASATQVTLRVADTGEGISADFLPQLFKRFSQADNSAARLHGGLGLGLSIVKDLAESHGGSVQAASEGVGRGSTFTVQLPMAPASAVQADAPARADAVQDGQGSDNAGAAADADLSGIRILVVDDHADVLEVVRRILSERGAEVDTASCAEEALARLGRGGVDMLLSDLGMPGVDGYSLMRSVRQELRLSTVQLPSAAVTAFVRAEDRARALESGYQTVLEKPVSAESLVRTVRELRSHRQPTAPVGAAVEAPVRVAAATPRPLRSLLVEDNLDLQEHISWMLNEQGVEVVCCGSAEDALSTLEQQRFDFVMTDISLPGMSGVDLAKLLLKRDPTRWLIFSTGYSMEPLLGQLGQNVRTLVKPFELEGLESIVEEIRRSSVALAAPAHPAN